LFQAASEHWNQGVTDRGRRAITFLSSASSPSQIRLIEGLQAFEAHAFHVPKVLHHRRQIRDETLEHRWLQVVLALSHLVPGGTAADRHPIRGRYRERLEEIGASLFRFLQHTALGGVASPIEGSARPGLKTFHLSVRSHVRVGRIVATADVVASHSEPERQPSCRIAIKQIHVLALKVRVFDLRGLPPAAVQIVRLPCEGHAPSAKGLRRPWQDAAGIRHRRRHQKKKHPEPATCSNHCTSRHQLVRCRIGGDRTLRKQHANEALRGATSTHRARLSFPFLRSTCCSQHELNSCHRFRLSRRLPSSPGLAPPCCR
jgi:hypothetical protein